MLLLQSILSITLTVAILLPSCSVGFVQCNPALPIPNARPNKSNQRFAPDSPHHHDNGLNTSSKTTTSAKGKSVPISGTPFRGVIRRLSNNSNDGVKSLPPSQLESIVANGKIHTICCQINHDLIT